MCNTRETQFKNVSEPKSSYANATKQEHTPSKVQAIILRFINGIRTIVYAQAVGPIIGTKAIKCTSRISNGKVCVYLDNKTTVANLTSEYI